jgi:predicted aspartyl protease
MNQRGERDETEETPLAKITGIVIGTVIGIAAAALIFHVISIGKDTAGRQAAVRETATREAANDTPVQRGHVVQGQFARAKLKVRLANAWGTTTVLTFDVDTGFTGELCAPAAVIDKELGVPAVGMETYSMADGWRVQAPVYEATALWHGEPRRVRICSGTTEMLLGMEMLKGSVLTVDPTSGALTVTAK